MSPPPPIEPAGRDGYTGRMTAIWLILALMTGAAVLALLWPMSRRPVPVAAGAVVLATETGFYEDQLREIERDAGRGLLAPPEAEAARTEAARRLLRASRGSTGDAQAVGEPTLRHRRAASAFALSTIPLIALLVYGLYGSPDLPGQPQAAQVAAAQGDAQDLAAAIARIEAHLARSPDDGRGWDVLAPVYLRVGRTEDAVRAYEAALRLLGDSPTRLSDYGEALTSTGDGVVSDKARAAFEKAVALDPKAVKPRFYLARVAEQDGDKPLARARYGEIEAMSPPNAPWLPLVRSSLARLDGRAAPAEPPALSEEQAAAVRGMVEGLDQRLASQGGSPEEWARLVRAYMVMGERGKAEEALARARDALGSDPGRRAPVEAVAREVGLPALP